MKWFDKSSSPNEIIKEMRKTFGLMKRNFGQMLAPVTPPRRPFTVKELSVLNKYFGKEYRWSDIDAKGNIILFPLISDKKISMYYITEKDLKEEIEYERIRKCNE